jgi:serine/threonine protein kinase
MQSDYNLIANLGQGSYGEVVSAECIVTGQMVAIKFISEITENEYDWVKVVREI